MKKIISIFCNIIDNFGDIGVCYRLARNLCMFAPEYQVNLYVNDLKVFAKIAPQININLTEQSLNFMYAKKKLTIKIIYWEKDITYDQASCVINTFACNLPEKYQEYMPLDITWIQLDYLATEEWADEFNGLHAYIKQHKRYFISPGFSCRTAGLLHKDFNISNKIELNLLNKTKFFIFAYINDALINTLKILSNINEVQVYMPDSVFNNIPMEYQDRIKSLNFCPQEEFDQLLQNFDILWLRGEDSFIRGQLSCKPLIWQAYPQNNNAQNDKINGFLEIYNQHFTNEHKNLVVNLWQQINDTSQNINPVQKVTIEEYIKIISNKEFNTSLNNWYKYINTLPNLATTIIDYIKII